MPSGVTVHRQFHGLEHQVGRARAHPAPQGHRGHALGNRTTGGSFGLNLPKGANTVPVTLSTVSGSATLIYDVSVSAGIVTITPVDITTTAGQNLLATALVNGTPVRVYGIPQPDGSVKAYYINCFF